MRTASREVPVTPEPPKKLDKERLKEGIADTVLNSVSILGEVIEDFRNSDRFFKYKALVLGIWVLLTVGAFGVSCPGERVHNDIDARLVVSGDVYMVKNDSAEPWRDVEILVNNGWRATRSEIEPQGGNVTLSPAVLFNAQGKRAPSNLRITDIELRVREPEASVVLLEGGTPVD